MAKNDPAWEVSFQSLDTGGYSHAHVVAPGRRSAIIKAEREIKLHAPDAQLSEPSVVHQFGRKEEEELVLDRLWRFFPDIYYECWMPNIKGSVLIAKARRKLGKQWSGIWIR